MAQTPDLKTQMLQIGGMDCGSCAKTIEASLQQLSGVSEASVSFATGRAKVSYNPNLVSETTISERIKVLGYTVEQSREEKKEQHSHCESSSSCCAGDRDFDRDLQPSPAVTATKTLQVRVGGMDCGSCAKTIEVGVQQIPGVASVSVSFATERLQVAYDPTMVSETTISDWVKSLGYTVETSPQSSLDRHTYDSRHSRSRTHHRDREHHQTEIAHTPDRKPDPIDYWKFWMTNRRGQSVILAGVGIIFGLLAQQLTLPIWIARAFYGIGIVVAGYPIARAGLFELRLRRADMNLLMTISVIGAIVLGDWFEGALVVFLFSLGTTLQVFTFGRTRNAIRALMDLTPAAATVKRGEREMTVPVESIGVGEILTIRPGQRVALDGVVVSGTSAIDSSPITGESIPEDKAPGDAVYAGTLNQAGFLEVKVTHTASDTTVAKIIHLVEQAQESRAPSQQWVDKFANVYTPIVILVAIAIALIPPLVFAQPFDVWLYRALVMLVIACPCALVISTPVSIVSAIGAATHQGVLFKGGNALETAGHLTSLAFDKTGTMTQGLPTVQKVYGVGETSVRLVFQVAASLEQQSEHPLAKAIVAEARANSIEFQTPEQFTALPGKGIAAKIGNSSYLVGNQRLFVERDIPLSREAEAILSEIELLGQTPVLVGTTKGLLGAIALADGLRLEAAEAMRQMRQVGLKRLVMLTGDRTAVAKQIAQQVGIVDYRAELLPQDKLHCIQQLKRSGAVGMVGDGINDAPALAAADISFAVGGIDIALETADVVLVGNDLRKLAYTVALSRRTVSIIQQNVVFSLVTKGLFLLLGTLGVVGLVVAVLADTGTSLLVTANGMRLFKVSPKSQ
ncbi:cadmium-translocating P-type ATPase [cyanobacterium TDX16]|nr:cadmium-translocating P-type ATPase [cyanobacterium TDX16]